MVKLSKNRSRQKGVAAIELAIGLPVLILVIGTVVTIGRLAHTKIKLDSMTAQAARECALTFANPTEELAQACVSDWLSARGMLGCEELTPAVTIEDWVVPYEDPEAGLGAAAVPTMKVRVNCLIETLRVGNFLPDTVLTAVATASRN